MKRTIALKALLLLVLCQCQLSLFAQDLPLWQPELHATKKSDWLVTPETEKAGVYRTVDNKNIILYNGILRRSFRISPNVTCYDFINVHTGKQLIRSVKAEAKLAINGKAYNVGGLYGQSENAYLLPEWLDRFTADNNDFQLDRYEVSAIAPVINWKGDQWWASNRKQPAGKTISFIYKPGQNELNGINVTVHYSIYDGLPLVSKWVTIENKTNSTITIGRVVNEILGVVEEESAVVGGVSEMRAPENIYIESNYAFNNSMRAGLSDQTTHWVADKAYTSQVNYHFQTPCLLEVYPEKVTAVELKKDETFTSIRTYELLMDSYDRERRGLAIRKMYRTIAPWVTANPISMDLVSRTDAEVRTAIDQCADTGYEALILSFGSHLNIEDVSGANLAKWKQLADYAHSKNIKIGCYSLFSSRRISDYDDVIDPKTGLPGGAFFGNAPCFGSKWGLAYRDNIKKFFVGTGFDIFGHDGPYPGDLCASRKHPGHKNLDDSQWRQMEIQKELYHWLNEHDVYICSPDWYFLDGTHRISIGYREVNFSLSRAQQVILNRQNIYDGLWDEIPSMVWGFVPLTQYHGGGADAILEPLSEHLDAYRTLMMQYYGSGVQAAYRGPRLYDTEATKQTVIDVVSWYNKHRDVLTSDIIHLKRADGRDWDGIMHVNPLLKEKGLMMLYNPLKEKITRTISIPLYYTGLTQTATFIEKGEVKAVKEVGRDHTVDLTVTIDAESYTWFVVE
ncbi:alpha-galactosidase [Mucilaginibacter myungsuensis]|uniref:Alpha-galactosidase n=1 Tax=Mucilaginibacter myungsuensis TaxID=649104 RepID=A0A929KYE7_9SPHI|nr:alpha-galactosidase [Mucilaginibacter myungsuensis]